MESFNLVDRGDIVKRVFSASSALPTQAEFDGIIDKYLSDNYVWVDWVYSDYDKNKNVLSISMDIDGDWKHDHLCANYLMEDYFGFDLIQTKEVLTRDSEDDSYGSCHTYIIANADKYFDTSKLYRKH